ncbi:sugar ABC transporter ATP-binding protein [Solwaraspora sp. WMMD937]|uniref:sugar ABC transporter ATP-binding protein n=1 Tax=Solwaraspora sp. WMMD937 TaxID=3016090 RepID=UPI00249B3798|nr:sugar ABC transporter ATP-binding protein [Solwaraspora sp. WMMD937]WFE22552.1 sugar ABC transporter ATP-binding protein [Solwaraspora sp. WMMD937]
MTAPLLSLRGVSKSFGGARALIDIDLDLHAGEVHALLGMNGAGKSTLVEIVSASLTPDAGTLSVAGEPAGPLTPRRARQIGITTVHQRRSLVPSLSVAENLLLGRLPRRGPWVRWDETRRTARAALDDIGVRIDVTAPVRTLPAAQQVLVEIAREVHAGGRVLILDEPTAALGGGDAAHVHDLVRTLSQRGVGIVYVSHHLDEVLALANSITVLRDGRRVTTVPAEGTTVSDLVTAMTGGKADIGQRRPAVEPGPVVLDLAGISTGDRLRELSLQVRAGEVVGVLGPAGDGQSQLFGLLSGTRRPRTGSIVVDGQPVRPGSVRDALRHGIRCVTGDRLALGLIPELSVDENVTLARRALSGRPFVRWPALHAMAAEARDRYRVVSIAADPPVRALSGGNQQKVLLAKWLPTGGRVCLLEEPTNGVDVAAKAEIHELVEGLAADGTALLLTSSDVDEVLRLADRVVVIRGGSVVAECAVAQTSRDELVTMTAGGTVG